MINRIKILALVDGYGAKINADIFEKHSGRPLELETEAI